MDDLRLYEAMARIRIREIEAEADTRRAYLLALRENGASSRGVLERIKHVLLVLGIKI